MRKGKDVALNAVDELAGVMVTAYLLRSPKNARRLLAALRRAERGTVKPESVEELRREMNLGASRDARPMPRAGDFSSDFG